jgi:hypothetical protein
MEPFLKDILTVGFSTASLIISIISLTVTLLNYRRQGGMVKFVLDYEKASGVGAFVLRIANEGFHSIKINSIRMIAGNHMIPFANDGFELNYGQETLVKLSLAGHTDIHPLEINRIEVVDISGKVYKIKTKKLERKVRA